ncbi:type II secretion system F family protein [Vibrio cholerae]
MVYVILALILVAVAAVLMRIENKKLKQNYLAEQLVTEKEESTAVNLALLNRSGWQDFVSQSRIALQSQFGQRYVLYTSLIVVGLVSVSLYLQRLLELSSPWIVFALPALGFVYMVFWSRSKRRSEFEQLFPDALNIMMSSITAGESVTQSIIYVGKALDNSIGYQFRDMGERLKLGEPVEQVFARANKYFPYPVFLFFTVTVRANISRGGQLKSVMAKLIRVLVDARTMEKKKGAMTSEARLSAKIVGSLPFLFMLLLSYINPKNIDFVLTDESGRYILYYVLISEAIGMFIIWLLIRSVR